MGLERGRKGVEKRKEKGEKKRKGDGRDRVGIGAEMEGPRKRKGGAEKSWKGEPIMPEIRAKDDEKESLGATKRRNRVVKE
jgi:hypothetical protein